MELSFIVIVYTSIISAFPFSRFRLLICNRMYIIHFKFINLRYISNYKGVGVHFELFQSPIQIEHHTNTSINIDDAR